MLYLILFFYYEYLNCLNTGQSGHQTVQSINQSSNFVMEEIFFSAVPTTAAVCYIYKKWYFNIPFLQTLNIITLTIYCDIFERCCARKVCTALSAAVPAGHSSTLKDQTKTATNNNLRHVFLNISSGLLLIILPLWRHNIVNLILLTNYNWRLFRIKYFIIINKKGGRKWPKNLKSIDN